MKLITRLKRSVVYDGENIWCILLYFLALINKIKIIPETVVWIIIYVTLRNDCKTEWRACFKNSQKSKIWWLFCLQNTYIYIYTLPLLFLFTTILSVWKLVKDQSFGRGFRLCFFVVHLCRVFVVFIVIVSCLVFSCDRHMDKHKDYIWSFRT